MNNKGFQLSINMLVVIIMGIALFGLGMTLFAKIAKTGQDFQEDLNSRTQQELERAMDDGSLIVIPNSRVTTNRGEFARFAFGFRNEFAKDTFTVNIEQKDATNFPNANLVYQGTYELDTNEKATGLLAIKVDKNIPKGQYAFDIEIYNSSNAIGSEKYYTGKKNRVYVIVR